jgi:hypothetical protein
MAEDHPPDPPPAAVRAALVAIAAFAGGVGALPYLLWVDRPQWELAIVPASAVLASLALRKAQTAATSNPSLGEWILGAWSAVAQPATGSLVALVLFGLFSGAVKLFIQAAAYSGFALHPEPSTWGFWGSIWGVALMVISGATRGIQHLFRQLYPRESWARSAFLPLLSKSKLVLGGAAAVIVLSFVMALLDRRSVAAPIVLALIVFYTSFPLSKSGEDAADKSQTRIVDAFATILRDAGYRIVRTPRTGKAEIDPLLASVDLLARVDDRAFAVQVKWISSRTPVEWNEASAVQTAALLLSDEIVGDAGPPVPVEPVLILMGGTVAQSLTAFSQRERVPVVHFDTDNESIDRQEFMRRLQEAGMVFPSRTAAAAVPA